jgi:hypothetical protein
MLKLQESPITSWGVPFTMATFAFAAAKASVLSAKIQATAKINTFLILFHLLSIMYQFQTT